MPSLKEVRTRIVSVNSTKQITSAMKMVSASKLRRAQDAIVRMRPYAGKLQELLENLCASSGSNEGVYSTPREVKNMLILAISSNRGLCGAFNANVIKETRRLIMQHKGINITVLCIGKKADDYFKRTEYNIKGTAFPRKLNELFGNLTYATVSPMAEAMMKTYSEKQFDKIVLVYNRFKNAAVQVLTSEQFLPVNQSPSLPQGMKVPTHKVGDAGSHSCPSGRSGGATDYLFEPEKEEVVQELIPKSLKTQLYKALLESFAAEHGARMTSMHKATDNATDLLRDLRLTYNKARQAAITKEILEIVGGAEALSQ